MMDQTNRPDTPINPPPPGHIPQAAAIPYQRMPDGTLRVLLTRRRTKTRWGIPKGVIPIGQTAIQTAEIEAMEEAGITGTLSETPVGTFTYTKAVGPCHVTVFLMRATRFHSRYKEMGWRARRWFDLDQALARPLRPQIHDFLRRLPELLPPPPR